MTFDHRTPNEKSGLHGARGALLLLQGVDNRPLSAIITTVLCVA